MLSYQVEVYNRKVIFEATKQGEEEHGYVALDNVMVVEAGEDGCLTVPEEAKVSTVPPETTTPTKPAGITRVVDPDPDKVFENAQKEFSDELERIPLFSTGCLDFESGFGSGSFSRGSAPDPLSMKHIDYD